MILKTLRHKLSRSVANQRQKAPYIDRYAKKH